MHKLNLIATEEGVKLIKIIPAVTIQCRDMQPVHEETDTAHIYGNWSFAQKMTALGLWQCKMILRKHIDSLTGKAICS